MMKWQNLIKKKCPKCEGDLASRRDRVVLYECQECDFTITERKLFQHLGPEEYAIINQAIEKATAQ